MLTCISYYNSLRFVITRSVKKKRQMFDLSQNALQFMTHATIIKFNIFKALIAFVSVDCIIRANSVVKNKLLLFDSKLVFQYGLKIRPEVRMSLYEYF